jgi:hypothetical protein
MSKRLLLALGICVLVVGGSFARGETSGPAPQKMSTSAVLAPAEARSGGLQTEPESAVHFQMLALERRARVDMLLYAG